MSGDDSSFFEQERERLTAEIASSFEELLSSSNMLNRKLEDVLDTSRGYDKIAELWKSFHGKMRDSRVDEAAVEETEAAGVPGTGGHVVASTNSEHHVTTSKR